VLAGEVGKHLTIARRSGDEWLVAAITAGEGRQMTLRTDFLKPGRWKLQIWRDAPDSGKTPEKLEVEEREVTAGDVINVKLARNGGFVMKARPVR
jgi:alpha-glucosidase